MEEVNVKTVSPKKKQAPKKTTTASNNAKEKVVPAKEKAVPAKAKVSSDSTPTPVADKKREKVKAKKFDRNEEILVISNNPSSMGFISKVNPSVRAFWGGIGAEQWIPYEYLVEMAAMQPKFFKKNWLSVDEDVLVSLRMDKYYQNALSVEEYENIFSIPIEDMVARLSTIPDAQKGTLKMYAKQLVDDNEIDSKLRIKAIEDCLDCNLSDN